MQHGKKWRILFTGSKSKRLLQRKEIVLIFKYCKKIAEEVFDYGDEFPDELTFVGHHYSEDMVKDVLKTLQLSYERLTKWGDYFIIRGLELKWTIKLL